MFKYLAGIFAKPHNDYVDGRLTTPLTSVLPSKKVAAGRHPHQAILKAAPVDEKYSRSPKRRRKVTRSSSRKRKAQVQVLDPVTYISNVEASSSSIDEMEWILPQSMPPKLRPNDCESDENSLEGWLDGYRSCFHQTQIPVPPPVSRVQSWMSLGDVANEAIIATLFDQLPYAGDEEDLCSDSIPQETTSNLNDWEMGWQTEEFWSNDMDAVTI